MATQWRFKAQHYLSLSLNIYIYIYIYIPVHHTYIWLSLGGHCRVSSSGIRMQQSGSRAEWAQRRVFPYSVYESVGVCVLQFQVIGMFGCVFLSPSEFLKQPINQQSTISQPSINRCIRQATNKLSTKQSINQSHSKRCTSHHSIDRCIEIHRPLPERECASSHCHQPIPSKPADSNQPLLQYLATSHPADCNLPILQNAPSLIASS